MKVKKTITLNFRNVLFASFTAFLILSCTISLNAQFKEESAQAAYELRMKGEILYARAMLQKLQDQRKFEGGLVQYEMSRVLAHQMLGGSNWVTPDNIIGSTKWAVSEDPQNVLFVHADAEARFIKAYMSMMQDSEKTSEDIALAVERLEYVLELDPDFHEVRVQLIEIYSQLPEELSGNMDKAENHASYLKEKEVFFGKLAADVMLPDDQSRVEFWKEATKENSGDIRMEVKLGKAYLLEGSVEEATPLFESAMKENPENNILLLHIARYHMYQAMQDRNKGPEVLPLAEAAISRYLASTPEPIAPLRAWALGKLSMFKRFSGQEEEATRLMNEATALDPSFSKATGLPGMSLYVPPGKLYRSGDYQSSMRPF